MKKWLWLLSGIVSVFFVLGPALSYAETNKWTALVEQAGTVLSEVQQMPDHSIPRDLLEKCAGIAIFPTTISGGFIVGAKFGEGIIMARDENTGQWSAPAVFSLAGGSFGWQIGGQATDFILVITNKRSVEGLIKSKVKLGGDAAVSAGPVGRNAEAATDAQLKGGILSYSRSRGLFAGAKLEGALVTQIQEGNKGLYGQDLSAKEILFENKAAMPQAASGLLKLLGEYSYKK